MSTQFINQKRSIPFLGGMVSTLSSFCFLILFGCVAYTIYSHLNPDFTLSQALASLWNYNDNHIESIILHTSIYPRIVVVLLSGAVLAFTGCIVQNIFKNNLLSPSTLGISSGIYLAVSVLAITDVVSSLFLRSLIGSFSGILTMFLVMIMARGANNSLKIILSGITLSILLSSLTATILRFYNKWSHEIFSWSAGNMNQNSWEGARFIFLYTFPFVIILFFCIKKLEILSLGDKTAHNLGLNVQSTKLTLMVMVSILTSNIITIVGLISFVGLIIPNFLSFLQIKSLKCKLFLSMLTGATFVLLTDTVVVYLNTKYIFNIFTGTFISFIGAIVLFSLMIFNKNLSKMNNKVEHNLLLIPARLQTRKYFFFVFIFGILLVSILSIYLGYIPFKVQDFYQFFIHFDKNIILDLRTARFLGAIFVGFVLGLSGSLIQSIIRNPVSSPEILGISSVSSLFMVLAMLKNLTSTTALLRSDFIIISSLGSLFAIIILLLLITKNGFSSTMIPLMGIGLSALSLTLISLITDFNIPWHIRSAITSWLSGSFYGILLNQLKWFILISPFLIIPIFSFNYYRDSFDLGEMTMCSLGMPVKFIKLVILILVSLVIGYSTTMVGPMSFVGLIAPHIARINGGFRGKTHLLMSGLCGAGFLSLADCLGQKIAFPNELPASLIISSLILPYFVYLMHKSR